MNKNTCVVVIPIHSSYPSSNELISYKQCLNVLNQYSIKIVAPKGLDLEVYKRISSEIEVIYIDPIWQSNLLSYNKLKVSRFFYRLFKDYEFLLTYELDAFVFRDELAYWCAKDYDYIGAPWFEGWGNAKNNAKLIGVGNSGFSLRKISTIANLLQTIYYKSPLDFDSGKINLFKAYLNMPYYWFRNQLSENYTIQNKCVLYEDRFFSELAPAYSKTFKVAPIADALKFSFEVKPEMLFELNQNRLPMGCHAWWKYNLNFWKPYIERFGYSLEQ